MKFAAGITLYNYDSNTIERIRNYETAFDTIFLFDNSDPEYSHPIIITLNEKFIIITEHKNMGLPYAFNKILEKCGDYDFLCTLDQDSLFKLEDISRIKNLIESDLSLDKVGVVAPFIDYGYIKYNVSEQIDSRKWVITSGSFLNLRVIRKESIKYDEAYFIDKFEIDLCENLRKRGYQILMYHGSTLHQSLGEDSGHRHPNHSVLRHYYLFRNRFYFNRKWHGKAKRYFLNIAQTTRHMFFILMYEESKKEKIMIFRMAFKDFINNRFGRWEG